MAHHNERISALTDGGAVRTTDVIPAVRSGKNVRVNGAGPGAESSADDARAGTDNATSNASRMNPRRTKQAVAAQAPGAVRHIVRFAAMDGDTYPVGDLVDGEIGLYEADGSTEFQGAGKDVAGVKIIYLPAAAATFGLDAAGVDTDPTAYSLEPLRGNLLANPGSSVIVALVEHGQTAKVWFQADLVESYGAGLKLSQITHLKGSHTPVSYGVGWQVVVARTHAVAVADIVDALDKLVFREDLEPRENDAWASRLAASGFLAETDRRALLAVTTDTAGAPVAANDVDAVENGTNWTLPLADGTTYTFAFGAILSNDRNPSNESGFGPYHAARLAAYYAAGKVLWLRGPNGHRAKLTLASAGVLVGAGNAAYIYFAAAVSDKTGSLGRTTDQIDWWELSDIEPSSLDISIPAKDIIDGDTRWMPRKEMPLRTAAAAPASPADGDLWSDTAAQQLRRYRGSIVEAKGRYTDLTGISTSPHGFVAHGGHAWVIDRSANRAYHFEVPDFGPLIREPSRDFALDSENTAAVGGCTDGTRIWIGDNGDHKAYAYSFADGSRLGAYDAAFDAANQHATSLGTDGSVLWVADSSDGKAFAHTIGANMPRNNAKDFDFGAEITSPHGFAYDDGKLWIVDAVDDKAYYFSVLNSVATKDSSGDFDLSSGSTPVAADFDDGVIWITDNGNPERVHAYPVQGWAEYIDAIGKRFAGIDQRLATPIRKWTNSDIGTSDENIATGLHDDDWVTLSIEATISTNRQEETLTFRFGDLDNVERVLFGVTSYAQAVLVQKSGSALRARRGGDSNLTAAASIVYAERRQYVTKSI